MLKFRDEVDYKALSQLGLVEPDDPAKALEFGFPERSKSMDLQADSLPLPMMLGEYPGSDLPGGMMLPPGIDNY